LQYCTYLEAWLEADEDDPGFQILTEEETVASGFQILTEEETVASVTEEAEASEDKEEEVGDTTQPTIKVSEMKDHFNFVIQYVKQSANENVFAYYEHLRHLRQLLTEEISSKQTQ
jgi:hypothetical protein